MYSKKMRRAALWVSALLVLGVLVTGAWTLSAGASPKANSCSVPRAMAQFGRQGRHPRPNNHIFRTWESLFCHATNLGPATSRVYRTRHGDFAQNFATTGHRIVWARGAPGIRHGMARIQRRRAMAAKAFSAHGIRPDWNLPVPMSWLKRFYANRSLGPALEPVNGGANPNKWQRQVFTSGIGTFSGGTTTWYLGAPTGNNPRFYNAPKWRPIGQTVGKFTRAFERQNTTVANAYLSPALQRKSANSCLQRILGLNGSPTRFLYAIQIWGSSWAHVQETYTVASTVTSDRFGLIRGNGWRIDWVSRGSNAPVTCPPWTPPVNAFPGTYAVGDSVMVDGQLYLQKMGITVDAAVSRQFDTGIAILRQLKSEGQLPHRVVIGLGTNGPMTQSDLDSALAMLQHESRVVLLTVREPRWWQNQVNAVVRAGAKRFKNVRIADWYTASAGHPEWFAGDGIHLGPTGAMAYAHVIANALGAP